MQELNWTVPLGDRGVSKNRLAGMCYGEKQCTHEHMCVCVYMYVYV